MTTRESLMQIQHDLLAMSAMVEAQIDRLERIMVESGPSASGTGDEERVDEG